MKKNCVHLCNVLCSKFRLSIQHFSEFIHRLSVHLLYVPESRFKLSFTLLESLVERWNLKKDKNFCFKRYSAEELIHSQKIKNNKRKRKTLTELIFTREKIERSFFDWEPLWHSSASIQNHPWILIGRLEQCENITEVEVRPFFIYLSIIIFFKVKPKRAKWGRDCETGEEKKEKN